MSADTRSVASLLDELRFNGRAHFTQNFRHALADRIADAITADYDRVRALHDAEIVRLRGEVCSCPSGDGSLRWPCKAHPPEAIAPAEAKGDALLHIARLRGISNHIKACPAYENLRGDADCIDSAIDFILTNTPQPSDGGAVAWAQESFPNWAPNSRSHSEQVTKFTRTPQPEYGFTKPLYTHPPAAQRDTGISAAVDRGDLRNTFDPPAAQVQPPAEKPVAWWNGIGEDKTERSPYSPSIRWGAGAENSGHDIPLYAGFNPVHYTRPTGDALGAVRELVHKLRYEAEVFSAGDQRALILQSAANRVEAALQHRGDSQEVGRG